MTREDQIKRFELKLGRVDSLPTIPSIVFNLTTMLEDPAVNVEKLSQVISRDQVSAARVLKVANSAYYGFPQEISTLRRAVVLLGFKEIRNIVVTATILKLFQLKGTVHEWFLGGFWKHSLGVAMIARKMGERLRHPDREELFVVGLLHDIGKMVLFVHAQPTFDQVCELQEKRSTSFLEAEDEVAGITHPDIAEILLSKWNLPPRIIKGVCEHHRPICPTPTVSNAAITQVADILCRGLDFGSGGDPFVPELSPLAREIVRSLSPDIRQLLQELEEELEKIEGFLALLQRAA